MVLQTQNFEITPWEIPQLVKNTYLIWEDRVINFCFKLYNQFELDIPLSWVQKDFIILYDDFFFSFHMAH